MKLLSLLILLCLNLSCMSSPDNLKAFPAAKEGQQRFVIQLDHKDRTEESNFKVELILGKQIKTDGVNQYQLNATLSSQPLKGWGFTYYKFEGNGMISSTRMAAAPGSQESTQFVKGKPLLINYNSRIPIVVYLPKAYQLRYKIWSSPKVGTPANLN